MKKKEETGGQEKSAKKPTQSRIKDSENAWNVIRHPLMTEKSIGLVGRENKLTFIVNRQSNKHQIKDAVEKLFEVKVVHVTSEITRDGTKKAYVKLAKEFSASEIATRLGML